MEDVDIFYGHLVSFTAIGYILWTFGIFCGNLVYFSRFGMLYHEKSGNHGRATVSVDPSFGLRGVARHPV
jgi:hypothetical protein